jgi:hypothetical protein
MFAVSSDAPFMKSMNPDERQSMAAATSKVLNLGTLVYRFLFSFVGFRQGQ